MPCAMDRICNSLPNIYVEVLISSVMVAEREIFPCHVDTERRQLPLSQEEGPCQEPSWSEP